MKNLVVHKTFRRRTA